MNTRARRAITLPELLVVVAIIGLLAGVLLPALGRARNAARGLECRTHLRQLARAAQSYAVEWNAWPVAVRYESTGTALRTVAWDWQSEPGQDPSPGSLWAYTDPGRVLQCSMYHGPDGGDPYTGYNYNASYVGGSAPFPAIGWSHVVPGVPPSACEHTTSCALFGDAGRADGTNKFMRAPGNREGLPASAIWSGAQSFRHDGATNVVWMDGHVDATRVSYPGDNATTSLLETYLGHPENGFLSNDDSAYDPR